MVDYACSIFLFVFVATVFYYYYNGVYLRKLYPYNTFLLNPDFHFSDFYDMLMITQHLDPYRDSTRSIYPPFANLFMYGWSMLPTTWSLAAFVILPWMGLFILVQTILRPLGLFAVISVFLALFVSSFPFLFNFDRGNTESYLALLMGIFLCVYGAKGRLASWIACGALAVAISLKIIPLLFCFLYFKDRRWRELAMVFVTMMILNGLCLFALKGDPLENARLFLGMLAVAQELSAQVLSFAGFSASLYDGLRIAAIVTHERMFAIWVLDHYLLLEILLLILASAKLWFGRFVIWESAVCLSALGCLLPTISNDYKLCVLISTGLVVLLDRGATRRSYRMLVLALIVFACAPKNWIVLLPGEIRGDIGLGTVLTPLSLVALVLLIICANAAWRLTPRSGQQPDRVFSRELSLRHLRVSRLVAAVVMLTGWFAGVLLLLNNPGRNPRSFEIVSPVVYNSRDSRGPIPVSDLEQPPGRVFLYNLECRMRFRPDSPGEISDLFATSSGVWALRIEYTPASFLPGATEGVLTLVHERGPGSAFTHAVSQEVHVNQVNDLAIYIRDMTVLEVFMNSRVVLSTVLPSDSQFRFDGLRVGGQFDGTHAFKGDIQIDALKVSAMELSTANRKPMLIAAGLAFSLSLLALSFLCWSFRPMAP